MSSEVFIQRVVTVDGQEVSCSFFKPTSDRGDFACRFEVDWPEGKYSRQVYGVDEVQALLLAMQTVHAELLVAREQGGRQVSWLGQIRLSLPVADTFKDWDVEDVTALPVSSG